MKKPRLSFYTLVLAAGVVVFAQPLWAGEKMPEKRVAAVIPLPRDFLARALGPSKEGETPPEWVTNPPRYAQVIQALGPEKPMNAMKVLTELGVTFEKGDVALIGNGPGDKDVLFVRNTPLQVELIETIIETGGGFAKHVHVTYAVRQTGGKGNVRNLLERSLVVCNNQRTWFERQQEGKVVEKAELEALVDADGKTVRVDTDLQIQCKGVQVQVKGPFMVRSGDAAAVVIYTGPGTAPNAKLEVLMSVNVSYGIPAVPDGISDRGGGVLPEVIAAEVAAVENPVPRAALRTGLFVVDMEEGEAAEVSPAEVKLPGGEVVRLQNGEKAMQDAGITLAKGERAWYEKKSRLLFLHAGGGTIAAARGLAEYQRWRDMKRYEVKFLATETKPSREHAFPPRTLLMTSDQRARGETVISPGRTEAVEAELSANDWNSLASVNLALENLTLGRETWKFTCLTLAATDGTRPVTLVSGRAADAGGGFKRVQLTVQQRGDHWQEVLRDDARRAAVLAALEGALVKKRG